MTSSSGKCFLELPSTSQVKSGFQFVETSGLQDVLDVDRRIPSFEFSRPYLRYEAKCGAEVVVVVGELHGMVLSFSNAWAATSSVLSINSFV